MALRASCPSCATKITLMEDQSSSVIVCPKCQQRFRVNAPSTPPRRIDDALKEERTGRVPPPPRTMEDYPEVLPADGETSPSSQKASTQRAGTRRSTGSRGLWLAALAVGFTFVLTCGCVGFLGFFFYSSLEKDVPIAAEKGVDAMKIAPAGVGPVAGGPVAGPPPVRAPEPDRGPPPVGAPGVNRPNETRKEEPPPRMKDDTPAPRRPPILDRPVGEQPPAAWTPRDVVPVTPAPLKEDKTTLSLPSSIRDVCVGGGGRFLLLHLPQPRQIAILDVSQARIVKYVPIADDSARFAAGMNHFLVVLPDQGLIQRWSLSTFEREVTAPLPVTGQVAALVMGSASAGPLYVGLQSKDGGFRHQSGIFLNPMTLKVIDYRTDQGNPLGGSLARASADGTLFVGMSNWQGAISALLSGGRMRMFQGENIHSALPFADGRHVFANGSLYTAELRKTAGPAGANVGVPAVQGDFYLTLLGGSDRRDQFGNPLTGPASLAVHMIGDTRPILTLKEVEGTETPGNPWDRGGSSLTHDKRIFLIPRANLLVTIPTTADRLYLHRFDLDASLNKAGIDYLFVTSRPPAAVRGQEFRYPVAVKSKKGGVKYKLESGPTGMKVSNTGVLTWDVPGAIAENEVPIILTVSDVTGQEVFHSFALSIVDRVAAPAGAQGAARPAAMPDPAPPAVPAPAVPDPVAAKPPATSKPEPRPSSPPAPVVTKPSAPSNPTPPVAALSPLTAAPLKEPKQTLTLPGSITNICVGGNGRYLILHLSQQRQFAVFDASAARVVKYLPIGDDAVLFAAGLEKLLVLLPDKNLIQRWDLKSGEREVTAPADFSGKVYTTSMGHASTGPLILGGPGLNGHGGLPLRFLDIQTLKEIPFATRTGGGHVGTHPQYPAQVRVSADGRVVGLWNEGLSPSGLQTVVIGKQSIQTYHEHTSVGHILPGPDGRMLFTGSGLYTTELKKLSGSERNPQFALPALHGQFYLTHSGYRSDPDELRNSKTPRRVSIHRVDDSRPLVTLSDLEGTEQATPVWQRSRGSLSLDKRLFLIPEAKLLVAVPETADRLIMHRFDLDEILDKAGVDYLFVTSVPPPAVTRGQTYQYALQVKSKKGGIKYKLESGPTGMKVSSDGKLTWDVPKTFTDGEVSVILTVSDATGQEVFHTFNVNIRSAP